MNEFNFYLKKIGEIGKVVSVFCSIVKIEGLPGAKPNEMIITEKGNKGMVYRLDEETIDVFMFFNQNIETGEKVVRTGESFKILVSDNLLGRIIDPLCGPKDGLGPIRGKRSYLSVNREAPDIFQRVRVKRFLETGIMVVDLLVPIGYGQRELVIGDSKVGKTTFLLQTIFSQARKGVICVYVSIGKETSQVKMVERYLKEVGVFEKVVMVVASPSDTSTSIYIAPYTAMTIAEYFRDKGNDVIIIFDDLTIHAKIYREISLLLKRSPGRSVYPGDIFHIHAALLERAGNIKDENGEERSITAFPVAETSDNDISGYIQTNLMAMTDGHIFFDSDEFKKGRRPAINAFLSVSRVGNQTKKMIDKEVAMFIRKKIAEYQSVSGVAQFGVELPDDTRKVIDFGEKIFILLNQSAKIIISREIQLLLFGLLISGFWEGISHHLMKLMIKQILDGYKDNKLREIEKEIKKIETLEELKFFCRDISPKIVQICYDLSKKN